MDIIIIFLNSNDNEFTYFFVFADALSLVHSFGLLFITPQSTGTATVYILVKLINNSRGKYKRNTYLINICKSDTDFVLIYISFKFDFLRKYH